MRALVGDEFIRLPDEVRVLLDRALWLAEHQQGVCSPVQAWESLAMNTINELEQAALGQWGGDKRQMTPYQQFMYQVLTRDGFECVDCHRTGALSVHHIVTRAEDPSLLLDVDNGVTLCLMRRDGSEGCHQRVTRDPRKHEPRLRIIVERNDKADLSASHALLRDEGGPGSWEE